eukprot:2294897-Amphidinium_carterae.1
MLRALLFFRSPLRDMDAKKTATSKTSQHQDESLPASDVLEEALPKAGTKHYESNKWVYFKEDTIISQSMLRLRRSCKPSLPHSYSPKFSLQSKVLPTEIITYVNFWCQN